MVAATSAVVVDERGRTLRATWHPERGCAVVSVWHDDRCVGTVRLRLDAEDVASVASLLSHATGPA